MPVLVFPCNYMDIVGPSIKYVTLEGEGVRVGVKVCDRGRGGQAHVTSRLYIFLSYTLNMKFKVMFNFLL